MFKIGLTGSIGMGKSTVSRMFQGYGIPIFSADLIVYQFYNKNYQGFNIIANLLPEAIINNSYINKQILLNYFLKNINSFKKIEKLTHSIVYISAINFFIKNFKNKSKFIIFEIPLLYETMMRYYMDKIIVVTTNFEIQKCRVMSRKNMTEKNFYFFLSKQINNIEKCKKANYIINTSYKLRDTEKQVFKIINLINML